MCRVFPSDPRAVNLQGGAYCARTCVRVCVLWGGGFLWSSCSCSAVCVLPGCLLVSRAFCLGPFEKGKV